MCVDRPRWIHYIPILLFPDKLEHVPIFTIGQSRYRSSINRWMASQDHTKPGSRVEHTDLSVARSADICNLKRTNPLEKFHYAPIHPFDRLSKNRSIERFLFSRKRCTKRWLTKLHGSIVTSIDHTLRIFLFDSSPQTLNYPYGDNFRTYAFDSREGTNSICNGIVPPWWWAHRPWLRIALWTIGKDE